MEVWINSKVELPDSIFETKEHILQWIDTLKKQIADIEIPDCDFPNYEQEMEACYKLAMYLRKLQLHEYKEIKEEDYNV